MSAQLASFETLTLRVVTVLSFLQNFYSVDFTLTTTWSRYYTFNVVYSTLIRVHYRHRNRLCSTRTQPWKLHKRLTDSLKLQEIDGRKGSQVMLFVVSFRNVRCCMCSCRAQLPQMVPKRSRVTRTNSQPGRF